MTAIRALLLSAACVFAALGPGASRAWADDPPAIEHQPAGCTIPNQAISLCASISDDGTVQKARIYFRKAGEDYYSFVDMVFQGLSYCGTVPAPREGKIKPQYLQTIDDSSSPSASTFQMMVQPEGVCEFPPLEKDAKKAGSIRVFASNKKQGGKLPDDFVTAGVTFVPIAK
jgi:hypothetical protein